MIILIERNQDGKAGASFTSFNKRLTNEVIDYKKIKDKKEKEQVETKLVKKLSKEFNVDDIYGFMASNEEEDH